MKDRKTHGFECAECRRLQDGEQRALAAHNHSRATDYRVLLARHQASGCGAAR